MRLLLYIHVYVFVRSFMHYLTAIENVPQNTKFMNALDLRMIEFGKSDPFARFTWPLKWLNYVRAVYSTLMCTHFGDPIVPNSSRVCFYQHNSDISVAILNIQMDLICQIIDTSHV